MIESTRRTLVVIPALNEELSIGRVVSSVLDLQFPVLVVDDYSRDRTAAIAREAGAVVLRLPIHLGVGGALRTGLRYAKTHGYNTVVQIDADGQHPARQICDLIAAASERAAHMVIGSRYLAPESTLKSTFPRRISMHGLSRIASVIAGVRLTDTTSGFRLFQEPLLSQLAEALPDYYLGDTFVAVIAAARAGFRVSEIPAALGPRLFGKSSVTDREALLLIIKVLLLAITKMHPQLVPFDDEANE